MASEKLFSPLTLVGRKNPLVLQHRVVMAPLTRLRADGDGILPEASVTYYSQRATPGGLLIAEATNISATARGDYGVPGIFSTDQIEVWSWNKVQTANARVPVGEYRALRADEIPPICQDYQTAALNALEAGFDGVELHAANGYLLEQFLYDSINDRTDEYGGSLENRARFLFEALDAIVAKVDSSKVGIRLSPFGVTWGQKESDPIKTFTSVLEKLNAYNLAYVHLIEPRSYYAENPLTPTHGAAHQFRDVYKGVLITASGYNRKTAVDVVERGDADAVAIGRYFISNPDLVERFKRNAPLTEWDMSTFYAGEEKGYIDYPRLGDTKP